MATNTPASGAIIDGYRFQGGDPSDQANWVQELRAGEVMQDYRFLGGDPSDQRNWQPVAAESASRSALAVVNDAVIETANAAAGGASAIANFVSPGNRFSKGTEEFIAGGEAKQSDATRASKAAFRAEVEGADGFGGEAAAVGRYVLNNPLLAASQAAGSFALPGGAIKGARAVAGAAGLGARGTVAAGTTAGVVTGAGMAGGDAAGSAYELVLQIPDGQLAEAPQMKALLAEGLDFATAKEQLAQSAARDASIVPAIVGAISGGIGIERLLSGGKGLVGGAMKRATKAGVIEGVPEGFEEGITTYEARAAAGELDPTLDPMKGVGAASTLGAVLGAGTGAAGGVLSPRRLDTPAPAAPPANLPDLKVDAEQALTDLTRAVDPYVGASPVLASQSVDEAIQAAQATTVVPDIATPPMDLVAKRAMVDRNTALLAEAEKAGIAFESQLARDQAASALPQAQPGRAAGFVDLTPMTEREASARLTVIRDMTANQGGDALSLAIVPHPIQAGAFAIGRQSLPNMDMAAAPAPTVSPAAAQNRIESASLAGTIAQRRAEDAPRQGMISRTMAAIEARGGVASAYEAELLRAANMGQPFTRIDPSIGRPASTDEKLAAATGIAVGQEAGVGYGARESTTQRMPAPFQYTPAAQGNKRAEPAPQAAAPTIEQTFVQQMRGTNTPAARAFVQQYESGQINDAEVRQALGVTTPPATSQQRIEQAAAQASTAQTPGIQTAPSTARLSNPALTEAVQLYGNRPLTDSDLTVEGATARVQRAGALAPAPQTGGLEVQTSGARTEFAGRAEAIQTGNRLPRPARVGGVPAAQLTDAQLTQTAANEATPAITRRGAQIELMARQQEQRGQAAPRDTGTLDVSERLQAAAAEGRLAQPTGGQIITSGTKLSTQRIAPGVTLEMNDTETDDAGNTTQTKHQVRVTDTGRLGVQGKLLQQIARIFGKRLVVFESDTLKADGFVNDGDNQNIFINARSTISPLAVFGHELAHLIKRDNPAAYAALQKVVLAERSKQGEQNFADEYGDNNADLLEELTSDLVGNRFQEAGFWMEVFTEIRAQNPENAQSIITRLGAALNKAINAVLKTITQPGFNADTYVNDLTAVKAAVKEALVQYAQSQRQPAMQMEAELARAEGRVNMNAGSAPAVRQPFRYTNELQGNRRDETAPTVDGEALEVVGTARPRVPADDSVADTEAAPQSTTDRRAGAVARARQEMGSRFSRTRGKFRDIADDLGLTDAQYKATALDLMTGKTKDETFKTPVAGQLPETVAWLDQRHAESGAPKLDLNNAEDRTTLATMMAAEAVAAVRSAGDAVQWYDETVAKTLRTMGVKYPELNTDPDARNAFLMSMAISSQTMNVEDNLAFASSQYEAFRRDGTFPERGSGKSAPAMAGNYKLANRLLEVMGPELTRRFLQTAVTKRELEAIGFKIGGESMDESMLGSAVFGPKIGFGFYSNLAGNFEPVTMDMWFMRTVGRLTGSLPKFDEVLFPKQVAKLRAAIKERGPASKGVYASQFDRAVVDAARQSDDGAIALAREVYSLHNRQFIKERAAFDSGARQKTSMVSAATAIIKSADAPRDAPSSGGERQRLRDVVRQMVNMVTEQTGKRHPPAALQALIWYPEQELYKSLGVRLRVTSQDYAGAAQSLLKKEGFDEQRINAAAEPGSGRARPVAGQPVGRAAADARARPGPTGPLEGADRGAFLGERAARIQERKDAGEVNPRFSRQRQAPDTPAFKKWFGDSVVVDDAGRPLTVYHGTTNDFDEFSLSYRREDQGNDQFGAGFYATTSAVGASGYANGDGANVKPLFVSIQNPIDLDTPAFKRAMVERLLRASPDFQDSLSNFGDAAFEGEAKVLREAVQAYTLYDEAMPQLGVIQRDFWPGNPEGFLAAANEITGHDGVVVDNGGAGQFFVAWSANQLKSATGNNGEFSLDDNRITKSNQRNPQVDTPAFKRWSKGLPVYEDAADGENNRGVYKLYHATTGDFDSFIPGGVNPRDSGRAIWLAPNQSNTSAAFRVGTEERGFRDGANIMPVYARLERPLVIDDKGMLDYARAAFADGSREFPQLISDTSRDSVLEDYDGIIFNGEALGWGDNSNEFIVFDGKQIKSATGNDGNFDSANPDITASRQRRNILQQPAPLAVWTQPTETKFDDFIYVMQDKQVDTKRVVESIKAAAGKLDDKWNAYLQEELYHGRTAKATKNFLMQELRPLMQDLQARGLPMAELEEYLHNRHAEERNVQIAKINTVFPDGGSGIDTADARAYLAGLDPAKRRGLEALAVRVDAITKGTRDLLVASGLETQDTISQWDGAYSKYVPLNREDLDFSSNTSLQGTGQGYSVRGSASKRATGSGKDVVDILANIAMQRERTIVRSEKTRVGQALYGLAVQYPNTDFWLAIDPAGQKDPAKAAADLQRMGVNPVDAKNIIEEPTEAFTDPKTGLVTYRVNPLLRNSDNVYAVRINGEEKYVFFNANDERSQRMAGALKNLDADQMGRMMSMTANVTRYFASINTQYNPIFGVVNFLRDAQGAVFNLTSTPLADRKAEVYGNVMPAMRGIYAALRAERDGRTVGGKWAGLWEEFQREGGQTGFRDMFSKSAERAEALQAEINRIQEGKAKQFGRGLFDWLSDYNETLENAVRLAAYQSAKDKGLSIGQSASIAKNLTVNFNRKGAVGQQAGALYAFFNAAVQGTTRLAETLSGPTGTKIMAGGLLLGTAQAMLLAAAGFDEDEPPDFIKERNLVIPTGNGKYIQVPMPLGLNVIPNTSRAITEYFLNGRKEPAKYLGNITGAFFEMFNPIGSAGWSVQTLTPTILDPIAALSENRDYTGKSIAKEDSSNLDPTPGYTRAKETASLFSKQLSYYLNLASGGTKYKPGFASPTPDQIDYLIGQATGGVGRELLKVEQTVTSSATGEELPPYKVPLLGRFYGDTQAGASESNRFYENITRLNKHENELKGRQKAGEPTSDYLQRNPEARLYQQANRVARDLSELRAKKRQLLERDAPRETIKLIELRMTARMKQLNDRVRIERDREVAR